ncbi:HPP family protein [Pestalotiopsis sp. NC0098]|nr:HPP family protein [Pestalotiopsis sp. NC0098]
MAEKVRKRNFTIDQYLNQWIPRPPWAYFPYPVSHFLGHRSSLQRDPGHLIAVLWATLGVFVGIVIIEITNQYIPYFRSHGTPLIIGSFGAAAVLEFYAIESPLAQPRNAVLSQIFASVIGVGVRKLFETFAGSHDLMWLGGSVSCAVATAVMALTGTVHPPAGATALLAVVDSDIAAMGWFLLPVIILGCVLMQGVALLLNNIQRRFPIYWWSPDQVGDRWSDGKNHSSRSCTDKDMEVTDISRSSHSELGTSNDTILQLVVSKGQLYIPDTVYITPEELALLETLRERL